MKILRHIIPPVFTLCVLVLLFMYAMFGTDPTTLQTEDIRAEPDPTQSVTRVENRLSIVTYDVSPEDLKDVKNAPLFSPTRRKPEIATIEPVEIIEPVISVEPTIEPEPAVPPKVQFLGLIDHTGNRSALILYQGKETWIVIGDNIDNWTVSAITRDTLHIKLDEHVFSIPVDN